MNSVSSSNYSYNDFNFSMQTSSGDTINLKMYDERSLEVAHTEDEASSLTTLSLSHAYGYRFEYEGNGIDAADKKEIGKSRSRREKAVATGSHIGAVIVLCPGLCRGDRGESGTGQGQGSQRCRNTGK